MTELPGLATITTSRVTTQSSETMLRAALPHNHLWPTVQPPIITTISSNQKAMVILKETTTILPTITVHSLHKNQQHQNQFNIQQLKQQQPVIIITSHNKEVQTHIFPTLKAMVQTQIITQQQ